MPDSQYVWGVNISCRGGILQTRPGHKQTLRLPAGKLQGGKIFRPTKDTSKVDQCVVFAVNGQVYYAEFPLTQPASWEPYRLKNISFNPNAKQIFFCVAQKSAVSTATDNIAIVPTYSVLMMQDGGDSDAAYFDGELDDHLDERAPKLQTPRGSHMSWTGNRLWITRDNLVLAGDISDPLSAKERTEGTTRGDFRFDETVSGLGNISGDDRKSNLAVFTIKDTSVLQSSILNRETWSSTAGFQSTLFPDLGCVSGRSIIAFGGLLWWYSPNGLVSIDSAQAAFLSSEIKYRDIEMGISKRNFAPDLSGICAGAFENHLLMSVPSGDTLNAHTMVLDSAVANELFEESPPAWNGVWTGTRPVEWLSDVIDGEKRIFHLSVDYQSISEGSFNHLWESFQNDRYDSYDTTDSSNTRQTMKVPIYCAFETKLLGDGMDYKQFKYAEMDCVEIGGEVNLKVSYAGTKGGYHEILRKKIIATLDPSDSTNPDLQTLYDRVGPFRTQSRRVKTQEREGSDGCDSVESLVPESRDKAFSLLVEWCGRFGVEALRIYTDPIAEESGGDCETDETGIKVLTEDGVSFKF